MIKSKAELLALRPLKKSVVDLNGEKVEVTELSAKQRDEINAMLAKEDRDIFAINARIAIMGCDFLTDDDLPDLLDGSIDIIMPIVDEVSGISGMGEEAVDEAKKS